MFSHTDRQRRTRRGVALILVLGMIGLLALIAVTFASYSGQAESNARNFAQAQTAPDPSRLMDYALAQLIDDTDNPASVIRGHSLRADMYGNDGLNNGFLDANGTTMFIVNSKAATGTTAGSTWLRTKIPVGASAFSGNDFTGWTLRLGQTSGVLPAGIPSAGQSFQIIQDSEIQTDSDINTFANGFRVFVVNNPDVGIKPDGTTNYPNGTSLANPAFGRAATIGLSQPPPLAPTSVTEVPFSLDGRYQQAFNGPGHGSLARFPNFRVNGGALPSAVAPALGNPTVVGMDEDYDACDLENWFLAIQSADGHIVVPSFHRPGILRVDPSGTDNDWRRATADSAARFLRPRNFDGHSEEAFPDLTPDTTTGKIRFDVDNDGDGVTDAVWLDLGYPASRNATGQLMKPLFAFTVIGLNGRIPLNTAGNIQQRDPTGFPFPLPQHATHLGNSPNEVNPLYALQNDPNFPQIDNAGAPVNLVQLHNLLTGTRPDSKDNTDNKENNFVIGQEIYMPNNISEGQDATPTTRDTVAVPGRWGEQEFIPRTVRTLALGGHNNTIRAGRSQPITVYGDYRDAYLRDDNFNAFDPYSAPSSADYYDVDRDGDGAPDAGALALPVERSRRGGTPVDVAGDGRVTMWNTTDETGADKWGRVSFFKYFRPVGIPGKVSYDPGIMTPPPHTTVAAAAGTAPDVTNNLYRGYESYRNPSVAGPLTTFLAGGTPPTPPSPTDPPALNIDEADEMNLYNPGPYDAPFGPSDLEYLYRKHDTDGASLDSRLARLAPVSFTNPVDGIRRRRMFGVDSWELNNYVWANDNPGGVFANGSAADNSQFEAPANSTTFNAQTNASFESLNEKRIAAGLSYLPTPSLAHRGRKINVNYPLPVSNDRNEMIRHKWIRDTYELLKAVLPPKAVDTPQELAQLSQFVVNMIDFRDPDCTMTRFVNTDLIVTPASATASATLALRGTTALNPLPPSAPAGTPYSPLYDLSSPYLIQHGMEYNPVAINEVLAYEFLRKSTAESDGTLPGDKTPRLLIEVVNTLTEAAAAAVGTPPSDMELEGWDFVVMADDTLGRPDPITGQVPEQTPANITPVPLAGTMAAPAKLAKPVPAIPSAGPSITTTNYYYVFGNALLPQIPETAPTEIMSPNDTPAGSPVVVTVLDTPTTPAAEMLTAKLTVADKYYWLYLRRPANPFDTSYDPGKPNANRVVVDSFRFIYNKSLGTVDPGPPIKAVPAAEFLYSMQRRQPYRGGHAVPALPTATTATQMTAYGYSEQTVPPDPSVATGMYGNFGADKITGEIKHTLGKINNPVDTAWDYVPFHDRDFTSVAELLMVPGCPPGLFTKVFAEAAPPIGQSDLNVDPPSPVDDPAGQFRPPAPEFTDTIPHPFPYLVDNFFYTGAREDPLPPPPLPAGALAPTGPFVGGPSGAGWFKMFEFLEVPSPANGAIGPVAQGQNFDWFRQDLKPGLLNLNLIIDEEVFLSLMGDLPLNHRQLPVTNPNPPLPRVVTQVNPTTGSLTYYSVNNLGYFTLDPLTNTNDARMKAAFSDFLKLRHGGSGYLFAFGTGVVGDPGSVSQEVAAERPFHSLSYPDINYTVMRPAPLPPSLSSTPVVTPVSMTQRPAAVSPIVPKPTPTGYTADPGVKNPYLFTTNDPVQPPPIPVRRLFQIPDASTDSNASPTGDPDVNTQTTNNNLSNPNADLTAVAQAGPPVVRSPYLGAAAIPDRRQHPYFRTEWLQKVTNLTTVRTHQYAVWVTVGFFEVTRQGTPSLAAANPSLAYDILGEEIGLRAGRNVRHRSFFIVDRTKLFGRTPTAQDNFNNAVLYRRRIQ